eukprot:UN27717
MLTNNYFDDEDTTSTAESSDSILDSSEMNEIPLNEDHTKTRRWTVVDDGVHTKRIQTSSMDKIASDGKARPINVILKGNNKIMITKEESEILDREQTKLYKKQYPLPKDCRYCAWIALLCWLMLCNVVIILLSTQFDLW